MHHGRKGYGRMEYRVMVGKSSAHTLSPFSSFDCTKEAYFTQGVRKTLTSQCEKRTTVHANRHSSQAFKALPLSPRLLRGGKRRGGRWDNAESACDRSRMMRVRALDSFLPRFPCPEKETSTLGVIYGYCFPTPSPLSRPLPLSRSSFLLFTPS